jgi:predicted SAM-dependent methyltransferase
MDKLKINLGCGMQVLDGWQNLDPRISLTLGITYWKWNDPLPFLDNSAELVMVQHSTNHCKYEDFDANMTEIMRVLVPGGKIILKDADDRYYIWSKIGSRRDGGVIFSTLSEPKAIDILIRNGFVDIICDRQVLCQKYNGVLTRIKKTIKGNKIFIVEGTKPKENENGKPKERV